MELRVRFLDLKVTDDVERRELLDATETALKHGVLVNGPEVDRFEALFAQACGRRFSIGVNSGTDALFLGLKALGIGPGDEVITTALSWIATANAIRLNGATPVFADIGEDLNVDPESVASLITPATKAILPVHYTGKICQMEKLTALAKAHKLSIVEDAAQAFSATRRGTPAGGFGVLGCFSLNPMKVFAACGEAGAITTNSEELRDRLHALRYNGMRNREVCIEASHNGRLDTIHAAMLLARFPRVKKVVEVRRRNAELYQKALADVVRIPVEKTSDGEFDVFYTYIIKTERRDELKAFLEREGVETKIHHMYLMPEQPAYRDNVRGHFPNAAKLARQILCLPIHEKLNPDDIAYVIRCIRRFFGR